MRQLGQSSTVAKNPQFTVQQKKFLRNKMEVKYCIISIKKKKYLRTILIFEIENPEMDLISDCIKNKHFFDSFGLTI